MQLAFVLYKYFPFGGLQRDFMRIALECQKRGHQIRVYTLIWEGDIPPGFEVLVAPVKAIFNHRRNEKLSAWMAADLAKRPVDRLIGFNKMPGLDVYYAADGCFEDKAQTLRGGLYRRWGRYRHFAEYERAVFAKDAHTEVLMISEVQQPLFIKHYGTPVERFHLLPPGISQDRRAPANAAEIRAEFRKEFNLGDDDLLLVQIGSGFKTKGVDRSLKALAALPSALRKRTKLMVIGQDDPKVFQLQSATLGLGDQVQFLKGRSDIPRFLLGADLLIHRRTTKTPAPCCLKRWWPACRCWCPRCAATPITLPRPIVAWCWTNRSNRTSSTATCNACSKTRRPAPAGRATAWRLLKPPICTACRSMLPT